MNIRLTIPPSRTWQTNDGMNIRVTIPASRTWQTTFLSGFSTISTQQCIQLIITFAKMSEPNSYAGDDVVDMTTNNDNINDDNENSMGKNSAEVLPLLKSIWDDDMIKKLDTPTSSGKQRWKCCWCNGEFTPWNATKAVLHVTATTTRNIRSCPQQHKIDEQHSRRYAMLSSKNQKKRDAQTATVVEVHESIVHHNNAVAQVLDRTSGKRICKNASSLPSAKASSAGGNIMSLFKKQSSFCDNQSFVGGSSRGSVSGLQLKLGQSIMPYDASAESQLTIAIADLIHSRGLPFSLSEDPKFKKMLALARNVPLNYNPPGRKRVAGDLLDLNYESYIDKNMKLLMNEANVFGISFFGDGATVKRMPLLNILASGINNLSTCLEIVDCTGHLEVGGKKDAEFIAQKFIKHIDTVEKEVPNSVDVVLFDGALNVQKAGQLLAVSYERITVLHGAEHVISLFFNDVFKNGELRWFIKFTRLTYRVFGSGSMHKPYAIFQKFCKEHNDGRKIDLLCASDTHMGGHMIALMRLH